MIRLKNFSYSYAGSQVPILQDLDLVVQEGEFTVLTGSSGCGKTTLALALAGFLFSQFSGEHSGEIEVFDRSPAEEPIYDMADLVGLVQQNPENQFCTLMVEDEIAFGLENRKIPRGEIEQRLVWALEAVGCVHLRERYLASLSGGEKQKIALAAILAGRPRVIIFDEPTSNLDPPAAREILEIMLDLQSRENLTVFVIEHKLDFISQGDPRILTLSEGKIRPGLPAASFNGELKKPCGEVSEQDPVVEIQDLSVAYEDHKVLKGLNLKLFPGELVSLLGNNGSGKTTLLLSLLKLTPYQGGSITFQQQDLGSYEKTTLGREIGLVFQNPDHQIFAQTVWDEAKLGPENFQLDPGDYEERTLSLLKQAGLADRLQEHPYRLSYGEKRRLNLISILSYQPRLLLLDEIFIGQDRENAFFLMRLLLDYVQEGNSVLLVNHNPAYYPLISSRLAFLREGKLAVDSPLPEALEMIQKLGEGAYLPGGGV